MIVKIIKPILGFIKGDYLETFNNELKYHSKSHFYGMKEGITFRNTLDMNTISKYYVEVNEDLEELTDNPYIYIKPTVDAYFDFIIEWLLKVDKIRLKETKEIKVDYEFNLCFFNINVGYSINDLYAKRGKPYYLRGFFSADPQFESIDEMKEFFKNNTKNLRYGTNYSGAYPLSMCIPKNRYFITKETSIPNVIWLTYSKVR